MTQAADKSKGSSSSIFSGKQTWLFMKLSTPYAERIGLCKRISLSGLDRRLQRKTIIKQVHVLSPPHPAKPIHFVPFQLSVLQPTLSPLVIFQESCRVRMKHSVAPSTPAFIGPSTSSHFTLKINRESWDLRQADWNNQSQMLFQNSGSLIWNSWCSELSQLCLEISLHLNAKFIWLLYYAQWVNKQ